MFYSLSLTIPRRILRPSHHRGSVRLNPAFWFPPALPFYEGASARKSPFPFFSFDSLLTKFCCMQRGIRCFEIATPFNGCLDVNLVNCLPSSDWTIPPLQASPPPPQQVLRSGWKAASSCGSGFCLFTFPSRAPVERGPSPPTLDEALFRVFRSENKGLFSPTNQSYINPPRNFPTCGLLWVSSYAQTPPLLQSFFFP